MTLEVRRFPCLSDNYGFLAHDPETGETAAIDTPEPEAYLRAAAEAGWTITQIWNTHHHADHAGGNLALKAATGARVLAPEADRHRIAGIDRGLRDADEAALGARRARVFETPGHTTGHIAYWFEDDKVVFVGDTLFALGCGRLFEGSPEALWASLSRLAALPPETLVYCAHEYTQANARFALTIEPENAALQARARAIDAARARGEPTVPTTIALELATNPFLRAGSAARFAEIRRAKDGFR